MTKWTKEDGTVLNLNDEEATIEAALELGWTTDAFEETEEED